MVFIEVLLLVWFWLFCAVSCVFCVGFCLFVIIELLKICREKRRVKSVWAKIKKTF